MRNYWFTWCILLHLSDWSKHTQPCVVSCNAHNWVEGFDLVQYDDVWKRRDVLGVHPQRQEGLFWVGACIPVGRLQSDDMDDLAHIAET